MEPHPSKRPAAASGNRAKPKVTRALKVGHAVLADTDARKRGSMRRTTGQATLEDRLEAKAARGDRQQYSGPGLDEMSREQRHKLLYGK